MILSLDHPQLTIHTAPKSLCSTPKHHLPQGFKLKLVPGTAALVAGPSG